MSVMCVTSFNKQGEEIKTKDVVLNNENVYKILRKYIQKTTSYQKPKVSETKKQTVKA